MFRVLNYLLYIFQLLQGFFFTICLINDTIGTDEPHPKKIPLVRKFRDTVSIYIIII